MICKICRNAQNNVSHTVREMEFGIGEEFTYFQCPACGCLQLDTVPDDMGRYYPDNYFAFDAAGRLGAGALRRFIDPRRVTAHLEGRGVLGRMASWISKPLDYLEWIDHAEIGDTSARILDVGCGSGRLLLRMRLGGFSRLLGIDPFINEEIRYPNGVTVKKQTIGQLAEAGPDRFDLIMFHHAFEHMAEPDAVLDAARRLLAPGGCLLIAIPVVDSHPWRRYGVQLAGDTGAAPFFSFFRQEHGNPGRPSPPGHSAAHPLRQQRLADRKRPVRQGHSQQRAGKGQKDLHPIGASGIPTGRRRK